MNGTGYAALVDTDRDELRERISVALDRFDRLAGSADPSAQLPHSTWNAQEAVAHVLTVAHRYQHLARGEEFARAARPDQLAQINQAELEAALAPTPELVERLVDLGPEMDQYFDGLADDRPAFTFHGGAQVSGLTAQTNWLGELLLHGEDIAQAVKQPWPIEERDMLLVARGLMEIGSGYARADNAPDLDVSFAFAVPGARPYFTRIRGSSAEIRPRQTGDRPDVDLRMPASVLTHLIYQRIGSWGAARRGLRIIGGRRPWLALSFQSCLEKP